jgi:hypothetical protein
MGHGWLSTLGWLGLPWAGRLRRRVRARRGPASAKREIASSPLQRGRATRLTAAGIGSASCLLPPASCLGSCVAARGPRPQHRPAGVDPRAGPARREQVNLHPRAPGSLCSPASCSATTSSRATWSTPKPSLVTRANIPWRRITQAGAAGQMMDAGLERKKAGPTAPSSVVTSWPGPQGPAPGGPDRPRPPDLRVVSAPLGADRRPPGRGPARCPLAGHRWAARCRETRPAAGTGERAPEPGGASGMVAALRLASPPRTAGLTPSPHHPHICPYMGGGCHGGNSTAGDSGPA